MRQEVGAEVGMGAGLVLLHLLLPPCFTAAYQEVTAQQSVKEDDVHGGHDGHAHTAHRVNEQRDEAAIQHQPSRHPGQRADAEHHVGAQVHHAVQPVHGAPAQAGHAQHLPQVQEDGVDLHQQGHHRKAHVAEAESRNPEAGDDLEEESGGPGGKNEQNQLLRFCAFLTLLTKKNSRMSKESGIRDKRPGLPTDRLTIDSNCLRDIYVHLREECDLQTQD